MQNVLQPEQPLGQHDNTTYWQPSDEWEQDRLNELHFAIKQLYQGNLLTKARSGICFDKNTKVLDIGCGPGTWILDMALEYDECTFIGIDLTDATFPRRRPANAHFHVGNVLTRLPFESDTFDLVHVRLLTAALNTDEWPIALREIMRVTKPGGLIQSLEVDLQYENDGSGIIKAMYDVCAGRGQNPRVAIEMADLLRQAGAQVIQTDARFANTGEDSALANRYVSVCRHSFQSLIPILAPYLKIDPEQDPEETIDTMVQSLIDCQTCWQYVANVAQKPNAP
ncbi:hypothetical protein EC973_000471 [Apophysomyces ossiformis]|uniref:Methyltransferase domain-containing protein n=1 Tax=Apophysomyces ossiformis TaxID=679940 RepID=A0A8H7BJ53_9FUNG|nr:hypothetical protein EC973_000471 [Apophysomyces ossiformis]